MVSENARECVRDVAFVIRRLWNSKIVVNRQVSVKSLLRDDRQRLIKVSKVLRVRCTLSANLNRDSPRKSSFLRRTGTAWLLHCSKDTFESLLARKAIDAHAPSSRALFTTDEGIKTGKERRNARHCLVLTIIIAIILRAFQYRYRWCRDNDGINWKFRCD